jgi:hypothetical protein
MAVYRAAASLRAATGLRGSYSSFFLPETNQNRENNTQVGRQLMATSGLR